jgi:hypothetical protein
MPAMLTTFRCLLISPSDVEEHRKAVAAAITSWNNTIGRTLNARVDADGWEHARPEMGDHPQNVLNKQIVDECDFGIAIFWSRVGTKTPNHESGSAEEVERLTASGKSVMVYFSTKDIPQKSLGDDQFQKLTALRKSYQERGLYVTFADTDQLTRMVTLHLTSLVSSKLQQKEDPAGDKQVQVATAPPPDIRVGASAMTEIVMIGSQRHERPLVRICIENHSPTKFFFKSLAFITLEAEYSLLVVRDALSGEPIRERVLEPGDSFAIWQEPAQLVAHKVEWLHASVQNKIGQTFRTPPAQLPAAIRDAYKAFVLMGGLR